MIDLHLHTTASDGKLSPTELVARAVRGGLRTISITDHDTVAGLAEAQTAAQRAGLRLVTGIEITAIDNGRDVHVLGYFFDAANAELARFLQSQRADRVARIREIGVRLRDLHCSVDVEAIVESASRSGGRSIGRPLVADALVAAGLAADRRDAFDRLLGNNGPAFVPRCGPPVSRVIEMIRAANGIASLAHPGLLKMDERIPAYAESGLTALEARHREHDADAEARYRELAASLDLAVSGGSDFHEESSAELGSITLSDDDFARLEARLPRIGASRVAH